MSGSIPISSTILFHGVSSLIILGIHGRHFFSSSSDEDQRYKSGNRIVAWSPKGQIGGVFQSRQY